MASWTQTSTELRRRQTAASRRLSIIVGAASDGCSPLPHSLEALDLPYTSLAPTLASLRHHVLSYLADIETTLAELDSPISSDKLKATGESTVEEARAWAQEGLEMLRSIRQEVYAHLPEIHLDNVSSVEDFVKSHFLEIPLPDVRARLPEMPDAVRSRLPDVRSRLGDMRTRISELGSHRPLRYIPTLTERLHSLQTHLSSVDIPHALSNTTLSPNATVAALLDRVRSSALVSEISSEIRHGEDKLEEAALEIARAVKRSLYGSQLIQYVDLPEKWRNNPFVTGGYRFIPLDQWPRLILSLFALHNETLNIHTHLIPFLTLAFTLLPLSSILPSVLVFVQPVQDTPVLAFTAFAMLCLFSSSLWHTMAGCAHPQGMDLCARVDYVGIGWLIAASVGTIVYYGFQCDSIASKIFLGFCFAMGVSGSILPFTNWFNEKEYRTYRISFFVALAMTAIAPLAYLAYLHSASAMLQFIRPVVPSLLSYILGLSFYATHFPECYIAHRWPNARWLDWLGGGSHAIWHVCIVCAIVQHRAAMAVLKHGIEGVCV
ncbi:G-protein coupled receptor [Gelatoporia subvermispora B]|uniref:G-protein coupled receptor n=1 Tax=Ceriporiopsis subvermispora (strain B) TaxID=914234 RepID=M2QYR5_CERS8|nr:G-protein coupled receptor [Gelatoporia subvermispora B]